MLDSRETASGEESLRCPTCRAEQPPADVCRRCRCDLSLLQAIVRGAEGWHRRALAAWAAGDYPAARRWAQRAFDLDPGPRRRRLLAACALAEGDFPAALRLARAGDRP